jgi:predicted phosphodiesterase
MRLAVMSDIHGNVLALDAVLADLQRRGGADLVVDLGDRVSGPLWPAETLDRLDALAPLAVRGNHDRAVGEARRAKDLGRADRFAWERLAAARREALAALPGHLEPAPGVAGLHARPDRDDANLIETVAGKRQVRAKPRTIERRLGPTGAARLVLTGHSHRPDLVRLPSGVLVLNPGSVGLPAIWADDSPAHAIEAGTPDARYALVELGAAIAVAMLAVPYDHEAAARRAEANGRPDWATGLRTGWARKASAR